MKNDIMIFRILVVFLFVSAIGMYFMMDACPQTLASYYTVESCKREGTSGIMASGRRLKDDDFTCASWDYALGVYLVIRSCDTGREVTVQVTDRGPNKRLYKQGRTIDLSYAAFSAIDDYNKGVIKVTVKEAK